MVKIPLVGNDSQATLVVREKHEAASAAPSQNAFLRVEPIPEKDGLLVRVETPKAPAKDMAHVPCDIVLVIDISGSMGTPAPIPGEDASEDTGLTVLDLVKHAARTILETLNGDDRLGIVTFGSRARVLQKLVPMTDSNKQAAREHIESMCPRDATNLWQGLTKGIKLFEGENAGARAASVMVLTDGMPNHMCPPQGYVPKLRTMGELPATIHTFGFGYSLRSGLLKSIAEIGGGNYAFIPDAGMIGTVFVHSVANLQATYAINAVLSLTYWEPLELEEAMGESVDQEPPQQVEGAPAGKMQLKIRLGNLQFGQPRDVFLGVKNISQAAAKEKKSGHLPFVNASVSYIKTDMASPKSSKPLFRNVFAEPSMPVVLRSTAGRSILEATNLSKEEIAYQESRSRICKFLASLFPLDGEDEHGADANLLPAKREELDQLIQAMREAKHPDAWNKSLLADLAGKAPKGQVLLALSRDDYFEKWGSHYLPSLLNAHQRQICNSFKDAGPLMYGVESLLFIKCRDRLDNVFDSLPAPVPSANTFESIPGRRSSRNSMPGSLSMARYNTAGGVCFAGSTAVQLASGRTAEIRSLRRGMRVRTPLGPRRVATVLKTPVDRAVLCRKGRLLVTPWHPISSDAKAWAMPAQVADKMVLYTGAIYSVLLERDRNSGAHAIRVGGFWGVTLGHGLTSGNDTRAHGFFGDYDAVANSLAKLEKGAGGRVIGGGVDRDVTTGLVRGFERRERRVKTVPEDFDGGSL